MKSTIVILSVYIALLPSVFAGSTPDTLAKQKECFYQAKTEIEQMLTGEKPLDYERAIFITENAYLGNIISYELYQSIISFHTSKIGRASCRERV